MRLRKYLFSWSITQKYKAKYVVTKFKIIHMEILCEICLFLPQLKHIFYWHLIFTPPCLCGQRDLRSCRWSHELAIRERGNKQFISTEHELHSFARMLQIDLHTERKMNIQIMSIKKFIYE